MNCLGSALLYFLCLIQLGILFFFLNLYVLLYFPLHLFFALSIHITLKIE